MTLVIKGLSPNGNVALLTGASGTDSLAEGRKTVGIIQDDGYNSGRRHTGALYP